MIQNKNETHLKIYNLIVTVLYIIETEFLIKLYLFYIFINKSLRKCHEVIDCNRKYYIRHLSIFLYYSEVSRYKVVKWYV